MCPKQAADIYNTHVAFVRWFVFQIDCVTVIKSTFNWKVLQPEDQNL